MKEYWDIYDENRVFQNRTIRRGDTLADGEYYICCEVWFRNSQGKMLVTQRNPNLKAGGLWEFSGGGVLAGETTLQAAIREVKEEIGVEIAANELTLIHTFRHRKYFMDVYLVKKDLDIRSIVLDKDEAINAKWVSKKELQDMIKNQEFVYSVARRFDLLNNRL